jgi:chorismate mutase
MSIGSWRSKIDAIDTQILALLQKRIGVVEEIGKVKAKSGLPLVDEEREREIINRLLSERVEPLSAEAVRRVFRCIIQESRRVQNENIVKTAREREIL